MPVVIILQMFLSSKKKREHCEELLHFKNPAGLLMDSCSVHEFLCFLAPADPYIIKHRRPEV